MADMFDGMDDVENEAEAQLEAAKAAWDKIERRFKKEIRELTQLIEVELSKVTQVDAEMLQFQATISKLKTEITNAKMEYEDAEGDDEEDKAQIAKQRKEAMKWRTNFEKLEAQWKLVSTTVTTDKKRHGELLAEWETKKAFKPEPIIKQVFKKVEVETECVAVEHDAKLYTQVSALFDQMESCLFQKRSACVEWVEGMKTENYLQCTDGQLCDMNFKLVNGGQRLCRQPEEKVVVVEEEVVMAPKVVEQVVVEKVVVKPVEVVETVETEVVTVQGAPKFLVTEDLKYSSMMKSVVQEGLLESKCFDILTKFDATGDGKLNFKECMKFVNWFLRKVTKADRPTVQQVKQYFDIADTDSSGQLDFGEVIPFVRELLCKTLGTLKK